jgi:tRNA-dihydrouridine synthase
LKGEYVGPREFRGQAAYYLKGISHSARTKAALNSAESEQEMNDIFDAFLEKLAALPVNGR